MLASRICALIAALALSACGPRPHRKPEPIWLDPPDGPGKLGKADLPGVQAIYLNRHGGTYVWGVDDPRTNAAAVVGYWAASFEIQVPAFAGGDAQWQQIVSCVQQIYRPFDIRVTDQEPAEGGYVEVVLAGGRSTDVFTEVDEIHGVAAHTCVGRPAVDFVFTEHSEEQSKSAAERVRIACWTAAHEAGHSLSLDHVADATDVMIPAGRLAVGAPVFQEPDSPCVELSDDGWSTTPRECYCGRGPTQSSYQVLLDRLGPAGQQPTGEPGEPDDPGEQPPEEQPPEEQPLPSGPELP